MVHLIFCCIIIIISMYNVNLYVSGNNHDCSLKSYARSGAVLLTSVFLLSTPISRKAHQSILLLSIYNRWSFISSSGRSNSIWLRLPFSFYTTSDQSQILFDDHVSWLRSSRSRPMLLRLHVCFPSDAYSCGGIIREKRGCCASGYGEDKASNTW